MESTAFMRFSKMHLHPQVVGTTSVPISESHTLGYLSSPKPRDEKQESFGSSLQFPSWMTDPKNNHFFEGGQTLPILWPLNAESSLI